MKKQQLILALLFLGIGGIGYAQQEALYSQYQFNQSMINPAYTGVNDVFNATAISRRQWVGLEGAPVTNMLNASTSLLNNKLGAGIIIASDTYGVNRNTEAQALFAYRIDLLNGKSISFGMQTGYKQYTYNYENLVLEQNDQALEFSNGQVAQFNVGAGIYFTTNQYYVGISVPKMLNTETTENGITSTIQRRTFYVSGGYVFDQLISLKIKPSVLIRVIEGQPISIDLNASVLLLETLWVGASLRNFNAAGINSQFEISDLLRLGYSFEWPLNELSNNAFGTHELMVSVDLELFNNHAIGRRYF